MGAHHDPKRRNRFKKGNTANAGARRVGGLIQPRDTMARRVRDGRGRFKTIIAPGAGPDLGPPPRGRLQTSALSGEQIIIAELRERIRELEEQIEILTRPDPETDKAIAEAGTVKRALVIMRERDLKNGTFRRLWDRNVHRADGGDQTALREYFQKFLPRDTGHFAAGEAGAARGELDAGESQVVDRLCGRVGDTRGFLPPGDPKAVPAADG